MIRSFIIIYSLLFFSFASFASQISLHDNVNLYDNFTVEILADQHNAFSADEAFHQKGWVAHSNNLSLGYSLSSYWVKFTIQNHQLTDKSHHLLFSESFLKEVSLYRYQNNHWAESLNGAEISINKREQPYIFPVFLVDVKAESELQVLLKIRSDFGLFGRISLLSQESFNQQYIANNTVHVFMYGAVIIIALFNFGLWLNLRDKIYLYYVGYAISYIGWLSIYSGHFLSVFPQNLFLVANTSLPLAFICLILFSQALLNSKKEFPLLDKVLFYMLCGFAISGVFIPFIPSFAFQISNILAVLLMPVLFGLGVCSIKRKLLNAKVYTVALTVYFIGMSLLGLMALGLLPYNYWIRCAPFPGSLIELVLFSLALANRINHHKQQALEAQAHLVEIKENINKELEEMVIARTEKINVQKKQLELLAITDSLTNLYNRRAFRESFKEMSLLSETDASLTLAMIDIDNFKAYNDTYGHLKGDDALVAVANVIETHAQKLSGKAFRLGGEEFALLFFTPSENTAVNEMELCRQAICELNIEHRNSSSGFVSASFGLVVNDTEEEVKLASLYKAADSALYKVKASGRNHVLAFENGSL